MNLKTLNRTELIENFTRLVSTERRATALVLKYIAEIERRKLYLEMAYPSLFEFLTKAHGYSAGSAMRRIQAARLLREIPAIQIQIESGKLNMSQVSTLQQLVKAKEQSLGTRITTEEKEQLINKISGLTQAATEIRLTQELDIPVPKLEMKTHHQDESVTLTISFDKLQMKMLQDAKDAASHAVPTGKWSDLITYLSYRELKRRKGKFYQHPRIDNHTSGLDA